MRAGFTWKVFIREDFQESEKVDRRIVNEFEYSTLFFRNPYLYIQKMKRKIQIHLLFFYPPSHSPESPLWWILFKWSRLSSSIILSSISSFINSKPQTPIPELFIEFRFNNKLLFNTINTMDSWRGVNTLHSSSIMMAY